MLVQNLFFENEFYLLDSKNKISYQWPHFKTKASGNSEMDHDFET